MKISKLQASYSRNLQKSGTDTYIVAVDDGSVRQPLHPEAITAAGLQGVVIKLRRNVGHQRAIAIGLSYVAEHFGDTHYVVVMDSDGEDTPGSISELLGNLDSAKIDVVVATRKSRVETLKFRVFYVIYKYLFSLLSGRKSVLVISWQPKCRRCAGLLQCRSCGFT